MIPSASDILNSPEALALLTVVIATLVAWQRNLGTDIGWFWEMRRSLWPALDGVFRDHGREFTREKGAGEYIFSLDSTWEEIDAAFHDAEYDPNGLSTLKYVVIDGERVYEIRSYAWREGEDADEQTHAYAFEWDGLKHLHQHVEPNVTKPADHHHGKLQPGDPDGRLHAAMDTLNPSIDGKWLDEIAQ